MRFRMLVLAAVFVLLIPISASAGIAYQLDWSGGNGIYGPVTDWENDFYTDTDIDYYNNPSDLVLEQTIAQSPLEHVVDTEFNTAYSVYSADIDGDGDMDILGAAYLDADITWWENIDIAGNIWVKHTVAGDFSGSASVCAADINGDTDMDILGAAMHDDDITWWKNDDGSGLIWTEHIIDGDFDGALSVYSADINGDGDMDVIGAAYSADDIAWWENNGSGTSWTKCTVDANFDGAKSVYSADVNGDGYMDILGAGFECNDIVWWENIGGSGTSWTKRTVCGNFAGATSVYSADIDGDGDMDILGAASTDDDITWWENIDGSGTSWNMIVIEGDYENAASVFAADIDNDGDEDVLGASLTSDDITWWENLNGSGTSWTEHTVSGAFNGARSVYSADVNGDGWLDVLGAAAVANDISWWDLTKYLPEGSLESSVLDVQESPEWKDIDWICNEPAGTSIAMQVRASDNSASMGAWSGILTSPGSLSGILTDGDQYFQYKVLMTTTDSLLTPMLFNVTVNWQPFNGIHGGFSEEMTLYGARPNPTRGNATLFFSLSLKSNVKLSIFDLTGRMVHSVSDEYESGVHEIVINDLACGMYLVRITSEEFTATRQFIVIE